MRIGVIDVGSNTIGLLVADVTGNILVPLDSGRVGLPLGEEIERDGAVSETSLAAAAKAVRELCGIARGEAELIDVFLTAPGRQSSNAGELVAALCRAAHQPVRVLTAEEEGCLAYAGAVATAGIELPLRIAVCDVGGASTEIAVGNPDHPPDWITSVDLGSASLSVRAETLAQAQHAAVSAFAGIKTQDVDLVLAVGGSARATRKLVGPALGDAELSKALRLVETTEPRMLAQQFGIDESRARSLPAGIAILAALQELFGLPLHVCDGGIRDGAALAAAVSSERM